MQFGGTTTNLLMVLAVIVALIAGIGFLKKSGTPGNTPVLASDSQHGTASNVKLPYGLKNPETASFHDAMSVKGTLAGNPDAKHKAAFQKWMEDWKKAHPGQNP